MKTLIRAVVIAMVATAAPLLIGATTAAEAAVTYTTRTSFSLSVKKTTYGKTITVKGNIQYWNGSSWRVLPSNTGSVLLERRNNGSSTYKALRSDGGDGYFTFGSIAAKQNAYYRVRFGGGSASTTSFKPVTAGGKFLKVMRQMNDQPVNTVNGAYIRGNVNPGWGNRYVKVYRKTGTSSWAVYKQVKTKSTGVFNASVSGIRGKNTYFKVVVPRTTSFVSSSTAVYIIRA